MDENNEALNTSEAAPSFEGSIDYDNPDISVGDAPVETPPAEALNQDEGAEKKPHEEAVPYDRFKEVNEKAKALEAKHEAERIRAAQLEGELRALKGMATPTNQQATKQEQLDFQNIANMTKEQVLEQFETDPLAFLGNLVRQVRHETTQHVTKQLTQKEQQQSVKSEFDQYAKDNPDFMEMVQKGEIAQFLSKNKYHNAITAHVALKAERERAEYQKKLDEAVKKAKEEVTKQYQQKGKLGTTLGSSPPPKVATGQDGMLKSSEKYGGNIVTSLVENLMQRRAARSA